MANIKTMDERFDESLKFIERYQGGPNALEAVKLRIARDTLSEEEKFNFLEFLTSEDRDTYYQQVTGNPLEMLARRQQKLSEPSPAPLALPPHVETGLVRATPTSIMVPESKIVSMSKIPGFVGATGPSIQDAEWEEINDDRAQTNLPVLASSNLSDEEYARKLREEQERIRNAAEAIEADETLPGMDGNPVKLTDHGRQMLPLLFTIFRTDKTIPAELCNMTKEIEYRNDPDRKVGNNIVKGLGEVVAIKFDNNREIMVGPGFVGAHSSGAFDLGHARLSILGAIGAGWTKNKDGSPRPLNLNGSTEKKELMWVHAELLGVKTDFTPAPDSAAHKLLKVLRKKKSYKNPTPDEMRAFGPGVWGPPEENTTAAPAQDATLKDTFAEQAVPRPQSLIDQNITTSDIFRDMEMDAELPEFQDHIHQDLARVIDNQTAVYPKEEILDKKSEVAQSYWKLTHIREQLSAGKISPEDQAEMAQKAKTGSELIAMYEHKTGTFKEDTDRVVRKRIEIENERAEDSGKFEKACAECALVAKEDRKRDAISRMLHKAAHEEISETGTKAIQNLRKLYVAGMVDFGLNDQIGFKSAMKEDGALAAHALISEKISNGLINHARHMRMHKRTATPTPDAAMA